MERERAAAAAASAARRREPFRPLPVSPPPALPTAVTTV